REFWLEAYGGRPYCVDRKGAKAPLLIPFNGVSVLGGIQPAKLASALLDSPDDGLVARFLWAWPGKVAFPRPPCKRPIWTIGRAPTPAAARHPAAVAPTTRSIRRSTEARHERVAQGCRT